MTLYLHHTQPHVFMSGKAMQHEYRRTAPRLPTVCVTEAVSIVLCVIHLQPQSPPPVPVKQKHNKILVKPKMLLLLYIYRMAKSMRTPDHSTQYL